ncbi:hypothetical protein ABZ348_21615 [Streptomyces sp. NPDC005963]|uniref:hypothetical protein n=1 Tax=Streptomyces sp. NPDC005963 TaxID=3156721 RepID=UPI0033C2DDE2
MSSPGEALERAEYVVTADIGPYAETVADARVYSVSTVGLPVLKGDETGHRALRVTVAPERGPDGVPVDPLRGVRRAVLFLVRDEHDGGWRTLAPGVLVVTGAGALTGDNGPLPEHWPGRGGRER